MRLLGSFINHAFPDLWAACPHAGQGPGGARRIQAAQAALPQPLLTGATLHWDDGVYGLTFYIIKTP